VVGLATDPARLTAMAKVAQDLMPADADERLAEMVRAAAARSQGRAGKNTAGKNAGKVGR
jgi:UDP-N-acetylglucosamine--N-acetylmuramyl-(pentapeptide) pyrophosphoryl-undecaprenol N-acetylglucosamine transferase